MTLKEILSERGMIAHIARNTDISYSQLQRIKAGTCKPSMDTFCKACHGAGVDPAEVLKDEDCY